MKKQISAVLIMTAFLLSIQKINAQPCKKCSAKEFCVCETYTPKPKNCRCVLPMAVAGDEKISIKIYDATGML